MKRLLFGLTAFGLTVIGSTLSACGSGETVSEGTVASRLETSSDGGSLLETSTVLATTDGPIVLWFWAPG